MTIEEGRVGRDRALQQVASSEERQAWIAEARATAVRLAKENGTVTSDEVRLEVPVPDDIDPRILGAVFRSTRFKKVGYRQTVFSQAHARPISVWELRD